MIYKNIDEDTEKPTLFITSRELKEKMLAVILELKDIKELKELPEDEIESIAINLLATMFMTGLKNERSN